MSHPFRQPVGAQPTLPVNAPALPARMMPPICTTGPLASYPVLPNTYGLGSTQAHQYVPPTVVFPQPLTTLPNRLPIVASVSSNVPRMFVPMASAPLRPPNIDPGKMLEEQKRLEKERNFQLQQQRLKQFTVAGKKGSLNADNLIDSMFGKFQPKKTASTCSSSVNAKAYDGSKQEEKVYGTIVTQNTKVNSERSDSLKANNTSIVKKDVKQLDTMMFECSDLKGPHKANRFHKPSVKELPPSAVSGTVFTASDKAIDWTNIHGLDEVFVARKSRFPAWCNKENVPDLYRKIQAVVTENNTHGPDTSLLFPILMSSGLSRELLGHIWELVNESASGHLTVEEMFALLALIAVAQAGHEVKSVDVLHQLPSCPVPQLNALINAPHMPALQQDDILQVPDKELAMSECQPNEQTHQIIQPTPISLCLKNKQHSLGVQNVPVANEENSAATGFSSASGFLSSPDDDFDDFKSATPTAVNFSMNSPLSKPLGEDEFDDFKQAPIVSSINIEKSVNGRIKSSTTEQDLMLPEEDKYSVFRSLQETVDKSSWGSFASNPPPTEKCVNIKQCDLDPAFFPENSSFASFPSLVITENSSVNNNALESSQSGNVHQDDEFGEFLHADVTSGVSSVTGKTDTDFADFSNFKQNECEQKSLFNTVQQSQDDEDFGEFTSSIPVTYKSELGHEFLFRQLKDNISLAESQSVSSLELGTFDGGGHSGESKSSLSRQDSIPSLDLKSSCVEGTDNEDCFGETHPSVFIVQGSKSPSPIKDLRGPDENSSTSNHVALTFQNATAVPLADKYSVIRLDERKDEDQHISSWIRCLQSSVNILQNTKRIFNQMSCSSVCNEVLSSEEGRNYVQNVIEVYKIICRIEVASKSVGKQTTHILDLLKEAHQIWNMICGFFAGSSLMPEDSSLNFSSGILKPDFESNNKACGLCLLNVEMKNKSNKEVNLKLSYGGRNYHNACANFWVNCVDPLLPALTLPQLL